jgi:hypothetical protein
MTKIIVLGAEQPEKNLRKIEFVKVLTDEYNVMSDFHSHPESWNYIELVSKGYAAGKDLMFAYMNPDFREGGTLFIGYWNDGVV